MKSFRLYKSDRAYRQAGFNFNPKKILKFIQDFDFGKIFRVFKKPIVLTILISVLVSLVVGTLAGIYIAPQLKPEPKQETASVGVVKSIPQVVSEVSPAVVSIIVSKYVSIIEFPSFRQIGRELQ